MTSAPAWFVYLGSHEASEVLEFDSYLDAMTFARGQDCPDMIKLEVSDCLGRVVWSNDDTTWETKALLPGRAGFYRWDEATERMELRQ